MFHKKERAYNREEISPGKRLKANLEDLFLNNDISALRGREIFEDAESAGLPSFSRLARAGARGTSTSHVHRDLMKSILKNAKWPAEYYADIRTWSHKTQSEIITKIPMLLPHELLRAIGDRSELTSMLDSDGLSAEASAHLGRVAAETGLQLMGLGLWLDGTPCNWDRSETVESVCLSFPGQTGRDAAMRLPLCAILKRHLVKDHTMDDLLAVINWSLSCCLTGKMPTSRHDGSPWRQSDLQRAKAQGKPLGIRALLVEVRADWACLKGTFRFPGWRDAANCCFRCKVQGPGIRDCGAQAPWRDPGMRHDHWTLLGQMLEQGRTICPLFGAPYVTSSLFVVDWLHCCDLGVGQDFLANCFLMLLPKMGGNSQEARVASLFLLIQQAYARNLTESKLDSLTLSMLRKCASSAPKLRSKAAETRGLIPIALELASVFFGDADPVEASVKECAMLLDRCYHQLSRDQFDSQVLQDSCRRFCVLYCSLEAYLNDGHSFRFKPKFHLWQELCEMSGPVCPSTCWTYRDEDFGGSLAKLARRRGGKNTAATTGRLVLGKFGARHSLPAFL